jgi:acyl carrier protein
MLDEVKEILAEVLQLGDRAERMTSETRLLGHISELDSMAVVTLITTLEERYGFNVNDDEISAETFATVGSLVSFVESKVA